MKTIICPRCSGHGIITKYNHVEGGRCFQCEGSGKLEVEDNVVDTIKEIREARNQDSKIEKEYFELWNEYKDEIRNDIDWNNYIQCEGTETTTKWEEKYIRINQYIEYKKAWKEYVNKHTELFDNIGKFKIILEEFESKYMNRD